MEDQKIIENFDSLWFFSNILSSPALPSFTLSAIDEISTFQSHFSESPKSNQEKPRFSIPKTEQGQSTSTDSEVETSSEFDSVFESETESEIEEMESFTMKKGVPPAVMEKNEERSRRDVCRESEDLRDFGLECLMVPMIPKLPKSGNPYLICKMPSLSDGMAMKKHLRLWAHAVACTVK